MKYTISLPPAYLEKIRLLKSRLGLSNSSEVIRRAIDELAAKYSLEVIEEVHENE